MENCSGHSLARRIHDCWEAGRYYLNLSTQCAEMNLPGMAWWFRNLADEEMNRALKYHDFGLRGFSELRQEPAVPAPEAESPEPASRLLRSWAEGRAQILGC